MIVIVIIRVVLSFHQLSSGFAVLYRVYRVYIEYIDSEHTMCIVVDGLQRDVVRAVYRNKTNKRTCIDHTTY